MQSCHTNHRDSYSLGLAQRTAAILDPWLLCGCRQVRIASLNRHMIDKSFHPCRSRVQIGIFASQLLQVSVHGLLLRVVCADEIAVAMPVNVCTPRVRSGIMPHAFDATFAIAADSMVLSRLLLVDDSQVGSPAIN